MLKLLPVILSADVKATPIYTTPTSDGDFRAGLLSSAQLVSSGCTKMAVLFSKPPAPSLTDCGIVCRQLEQATLQLVSTLYRLNPDSQGKVKVCNESDYFTLSIAGRTLQGEAQSNVVDILSNVKKLMEVFIKKGCSRYIRTLTYLNTTGPIWICIFY